MNIKLIYKLLDKRELSFEEYLHILENRNDISKELFKFSNKVTKEYFNNKIYVRGLIEFSNFCKNDCYYCGIRASNKNAKRYRLSKEEILKSVSLGTEIGFKTFVLQGGEDPYFSEDLFIDIIRSIKKINPDCAVTLSIGEKDYSTLKKLRENGADRFLLRHETINRDHYYYLHPREMSYDNRLECLDNLKKLKYQTGSGIMVGSPKQSLENIAEDLVYLKKLNPEMVGIGPFVSQKDSPFSNYENGDVDLTIFLIGILRLMFPRANIPATTSLQTLDSSGRERAIKAGANVFMPNLTPEKHREDYALYDNKACFKMEAAENLNDLKRLIADIGYELVMSRGDY